MTRSHHKYELVRRSPSSDSKDPDDEGEINVPESSLEVGNERRERRLKCGRWRWVGLGVLVLLCLMGYRVEILIGTRQEKILRKHNDANDDNEKQAFEKLVDSVQSETSLFRRENGVQSMVVGVVTSKEAEVVVGVGNQAHLDTLFEIGSITKTFTAIMLAEAIAKKQVTLDQKVQTLLPEAVRLPKDIRDVLELVHLTTHTSGFPSIPEGFMSLRRFINALVFFGRGPYSDVSKAEFNDDLEKVEPLFSPPGSQYSYSNMAVGLLGSLLRVHTSEKKTYEEWVTDRICNPLGLTDTVVDLGHHQRRRLAKGHGGGAFLGGPFYFTKRAPNWDITEPFAAAGAIRSTVADMMVYLKANMNLLDPPQSLAEAMRLSHQVIDLPRFDNSTYDGPPMAMNWHRFKLGSQEQANQTVAVIWHNGGTGGYRTFLGFVDEEDHRCGAVILANTAVAVDVLAVKILQECTCLGREYPCYSEAK